MPTPAQFSERTYETAVNAALARLGDGPCPACGAGGHGVEVWAPGQLLEMTVGFDAAISFANPAVAAVPWHHGLTAEQAQEAASGPPVASVFVQYKRPEGMTNLKASMRGTITSPYQRFLLTPHQHDALVGLKVSSGGLADVGYVAPDFLTSNELRQAITNGTILDQAVFLEVPVPVPGVGHKEGAFDHANAGFFSEAETVQGPALSDVIADAISRARQREDFGVHRHVLRLGRALSQDAARFGVAGEPAEGNPEEEQQVAAAASVVFEQANAGRASWLILTDRSENGGR